MDSEVDCKCTKIIGHLEDVKWLQWHRDYKPSPGPLCLGDWVDDQYIWLHYVESADGTLRYDPVLMSTDSRYWSIHDVQRYWSGELHCEQVLFTCQYPNLRMPSQLGSYFWRTNVALKLPPKLYQKELHQSIEITLKKMEHQLCQINRLIIPDQLIKLHRLDYFKRKTFFRLLQNILSFQDDLQLVSFENLCCKRLEAVRLIQQLACFNSKSLKYLFLWRFVLPNENPILINYSYIKATVAMAALITKMATDEEKVKLAKLLREINVPELKLTERCLDLVKDFQQKFGGEVESEEQDKDTKDEDYENPYKVDKNLIDDIDKKLHNLLKQSKRSKKKAVSNNNTVATATDPKRPWRINSSKEKLLRIENKIKRHHERAGELVIPLDDGDMKDLLQSCSEENHNSAPIAADRLRNTVDEAKKNLPNFQYRKIENTTATLIFPDAHALQKEDA